VSAPGHDTITTHLFAAGSQYLDSDAVFGVKDSLITAFKRHDAGKAPDGTVRNEPYYTVNYDFRLRPAG
jgi:hydroxyquinol 1,2-dioxygenase